MPILEWVLIKPTKTKRMKNTISFIAILLSLGLIACHCGKKVKKGKDAQSKNIIPVERKSDYVEPAANPAANFTITDMNVQGDVAMLVVNYSGGCKDHTFKAYFNGNFMKSLPPRANVFIEHDNGGDNCRKLVMDTLYFDLKEVRYYKDKAGTVIVGFNGTDQTLKYIHD